MSPQMNEVMQKRLRLGAVGSVGAITLLWLACLAPSLFVLGTVLLTMSVVPLATGFRARGGLLLGMLFGVLWVAAKLGVTGTMSLADLLRAGNAIPVVAMMTVGVLSGVFFGSSHSVGPASAGAAGDTRKPSGIPHPPALALSEQERDIQQALRSHREWLAGWDREQDPWASFDTHVRELVRRLTGAGRIRCYRVSDKGGMELLSGATTGQATTIDPGDELLNHVLTSGRRFVATSSQIGEMLRELADRSKTPYAWIVPIREDGRTRGLVTVGELADDSIDEERLELVADLIEKFWLDLRTADGLRIARLMDRASGVFDRVELLAILDQTIERCYDNCEPVVMFALAVEGIRTMDDGGHWEQRDDVVEIIGQTMQSRLRRDDVVGRFSDDRFIAVLRRLDVSLAHLIARKIIEALEKELRRRAPQLRLILRAGLAGSGFERIPAQPLLLTAFASIAEARNRGLTLLPLSKEAASVAVNT